MMNWFMDGGSGMFLILAIGVGSIFHAVKVVREPTAPRLAALRSLPTLIVMSALEKAFALTTPSPCSEVPGRGCPACATLMKSVG